VPVGGPNPSPQLQATAAKAQLGRRGNESISGWWFGTMEFYDCPYIGKLIIPTDELIFFRGVGQPPTSQKTWQWFKKHGNG